MIMIARVVGDDAGWEEEKHPRDDGGKFAKTAGGGSGLGKTTTNLNWQVAKQLSDHGFKKVKGTTLPTFTHPSGVQVIIHPTEGQKSSSKFEIRKTPKEESGQHGTGHTGLAYLLNAHGINPEKLKEGSAQQQPTKTAAPPAPASPAPTSPAPEAEKSGNSEKIQQILHNHGYTELGDSATKPGAKIFITAGSRIEINPTTEAWAVEKSGYSTKVGSGLKNLDTLLSGGMVPYKAGEPPPWKVAPPGTKILTEKELTKQKAEQEAAQKAYAEKQKKQKEEYEAKEKKKNETNAFYQKLIGHAPEPSSVERSAVSDYSGSSFTFINNFLRENFSLTKKELSETSHGAAKKVLALDSYLDKCSFPEDGVVYRGIRADCAKVMKSLLFEGSKFMERGFMSTSASEEFSDNWKHDGLMLKINVKKGARAAAIAKYSQHPGEKEVLFARNYIFHVKSYDPKNRTAEVDLEERPS